MRADPGDRWRNVPNLAPTSPIRCMDLGDEPKPHQVGADVAALAAGTVREGTGDYLAAFAGAGLLCLIAAGMSLQIGRATIPAVPRLQAELDA